MQVFRFFGSPDLACAFRATHGTGGWIFAPDSDGNSILCPCGLTASAVMTHQVTRGQSGRLL